MSTGIAPAALVASIAMSAPCSRLPSMRWTGACTPVDVSFCAQQYVSTYSVRSGTQYVPGSLSKTIGSSRNGADATDAATFLLNDPYTPQAAWRVMSDEHITSQNALAPPLPSTTS